MRWAVHSEALHSIRLSQFENITAPPPATAHSHTDRAGKQHMKSSILSYPDELTVRQAAFFFFYAPTVHVDISLCQQPSPWGKSQSSRGAVLEGKTSLRVWHLICLSGHHFILSGSQTWHRVSLTCCVVVFSFSFVFVFVFCPPCSKQSKAEHFPEVCSVSMIMLKNTHQGPRRQRENPMKCFNLDSACRNQM